MGKIVPKKKFFKSSIYSPKLHVGSHIDNVRNSLENLIFSNERETERSLLKKRIKVVVVVTIFLMVIGSILSPKGTAEIATFYPTSCLGGWNNPRNAEGEPQVKSNATESDFTNENSATLPATTSADIYCGNFVGTIDQYGSTTPTKILVSLSWSKGGDVILEKKITGDDFASSSGEILDSTSTVDISFTLASSTDILASSTDTLASSTESTTTEVVSTNDASSTEVIASSTEEVVVEHVTPIEETSLIQQVVNIVEDVIQKVTGNDTPSVENTPVVQPSAPAPENIPQPEVPPASDSAPTSFLDTVTRKITGLFFKKVFAEEIPTLYESITEDVQPITEITTTTSTPEISTTEKVESVQQEEVQPLIITDDIVSTTIENNENIIIENVASSTDNIASTTDGIASTTESTSTQSIIDTAIDVLTGNDSSNDFLEVLYTFDGVIWNSLGKVDENSMKYRTFEIPVTASTSWSDMGQLQIKVQSVQRIDAKPTVYLDGIKVEVLYDSPIIHEHPDFTRDTILQDEIVNGIRVVRIINNDTNEQEVWYMYVEEEVATSSLETIASSTVEIGTTTESVSTSTNTVTIIDNVTGTTSVSVIEAEVIIGTTTEELIDNSTTTIIKERKKNFWFKYEGGVESPTVEDISSFEEKKDLIEMEEESKLDVVLDLLPDLLSERIKRIKGSFLGLVIIQVKGEKEDELWLYNTETGVQEKINVGSSTTVSSDFPFGIKGGFLFWLSQDKSFIYAYNPVTKVFFEKEMSSFDFSNGERAEIYFEEIKWKVIVNNENFTFFSDETGEVFSDEDSQSLNSLRQKINLDDILNEEKLNKLDFSVEEIKEYPIIGE